MATRILTEGNFDEVVNGNDVVFVCFCDSSSSACRRFAPSFEASSNEHLDVVYGTVDVEAEHGLAAALAANASNAPRRNDDCEIFMSSPHASHLTPHTCFQAAFPGRWPILASRSRTPIIRSMNSRFSW